MKFNAWDLGTEVEDKPKIPGFVKSKFIVTKIVPPKGKSIRDGIVIHAALISYNGEDGDVQVTKVTEGPAGLEVEFPLGKFLVRATKFRGPKNWYNFIHPETGKWTRIPQEKFTVEFATSYLASNMEGWETLDEQHKEELIDTYFEDMYMFGLACDFNFDTAKEDFTVPKVGMVTDFYRRYTPPAVDEKYGKTIITKWPDKKNPMENENAPIDGEFSMKDASMAEAIIAALDATEKQKDFDPASDDDEPPF